MKKLILTIGMCVGFAVSAFAQSSITTNIVTTGAAGDPSHWVRLPISNSVIDQVSFVTTATNGVTVYAYDSPLATNKVTLAAYTSIISYPTNLVQNYVTTSGVTNFMTNSYIFTTLQTNAAASTSLPLAATYGVAANVSVDYLNQQILIVRGLSLNINSNATITVYYHAAN